MNPLQLFFHWPEGGVWSNLVASLLWTLLAGIPAYFWGRSKARKHLTRIHDRLDSQDRQMALHAARLQAVHKHVKEKL